MQKNRLQNRRKAGKCLLSVPFLFSLYYELLLFRRRRALIYLYLGRQDRHTSDVIAFCFSISNTSSKDMAKKTMSLLHVI